MTDDGMAFLHIAGCVLFLGNIVTAAFWKVRADLKGILQRSITQ